MRPVSPPFLPNIGLKADAPAQKFAFLGISGSGKTYGAGRFVEWLWEQCAQVVVVDVIGNWWGLRLGADGKHEGIPIPVLGGARGDAPLEPTGGELAAEVVAGTRASAVLDVSDFTGGELRRFVADFATALLRAKKKNPGPLMVVWEECQDVVPQHVGRDQAQMVGAVEKLIKKGRNYGVGTTLISQRPQAVNKDVLNQIETLFVYRTVGSQERKAIEAWVTHQSVDVAGIVKTLPQLETGDAYCWSPQWLGVLDLVRATKKSTYDNSSTPTYANGAATTLPAIDIEAFKTRMAATIERAKADDPKALKARVAELQREVEKLLKQAPAIERVEVPVLDREAAHRVEVAMEAFLEKLKLMVSHLGEKLQPVVEQIRSVKAPAPVVAPPRALAETAALRQRPTATPNHGTKMGRGEAAVLTALIQHPAGGLRREQLTVITGYKRSSRDTYLQRLLACGYAAQEGDRIAATHAGIAALPNVPPLPTGAKLAEHYLSTLPKGESEILWHVVHGHPRVHSRDQLGDLVGYKRSSRDTYIQRLAARGIVHAERDGVRLDEMLVDR